ncbi:Beta-fructofuranosidase, insoluble isoenzyme 1 [Linum perenne]
MGLRRGWDLGLHRGWCRAWWLRRGWCRGRAWGLGLVPGPGLGAVLGLVPGLVTSHIIVEVTFSFKSLTKVEPFDLKFVDLLAQDVYKVKGSTVEGGIAPFGLLTLASEKVEEYTSIICSRCLRRREACCLILL